MAPWGKVHSSMSNMADRAKGHILWAGHKYRQGLHLASKASDIYQSGKRIASVFMPELNALGMDKYAMQGFGAVDNMMHKGIERHQDVLNQISDNSAILGKLRQAQTMAQPYMS